MPDQTKYRQTKYRQTKYRQTKYRTNAEKQAAYRQRMRQAQEKQLTERSLPPLPAIPSIPGEARWRAALGQAEWLVETTVNEMQEYYEERSEAWQESERGGTFEDRLHAVQELLSSLGELAA
jgi:hypothetical protein